MNKLALGVMAAACAMGLANAAPAVGSLAPGFRLQDQNFDWHELEDYRGQWLVLYFYPKADTPGCTRESCEFRDNIFAYQELGVAVVGISLDDVGSQKEFAEKYHLPFPLLSDSEKVVAERYGVLRGFGPFSFTSRQTFLIDPEGKIAKHYEKVVPRSHSGEVLTHLNPLI